MQEFITAARDEFEPEEVGSHTIKLDGREIVLREPGTAQAAVMATFTRGEMTAEKVSTFISFFFSLLPNKDDQMYIEDRLLDFDDPFEIDSENGLLDIFFWLLEEMSAQRPPVEPTDYQPSQRATGQRSTATTRAKASTSSASRSRASSRSSKSGTSKG